MKSEIKTVTPKDAKDWLGKNKVNRKLRQNYVTFLSNEIRQGRFIFTGDPIKFDVEGELLDGQHRLSAIVEANLPLTLAIVEGLSPETYYKIDTGIPRSLADATGITAKLVQIYSVMLDVVKGIGLRKSTNDILALHEYIGIIGLALRQHCGTNRKFFASAPLRAAAVVSVKTGQPKDYVFDIYRRLVNLDSEIPIAKILARLYIDHPFRLTKYKVGESSTRVEAFLLGMYVFDVANRDRKKILLQNKRVSYLALCRDVVTKALSIDVPKLSFETTERKYQQAVKENIQLKERIIRQKRIDAQPD